MSATNPHTEHTSAGAPRILPLEPPYAPDVAEVLQQMMPPGVPPIALFRTLARNPRILHKLRLGNLLDRGALSLRERELIILRTTARCGAGYEWGVHVAFFAHKAGFSAEQIDAVTRAPASAPVWSPREALLLRMVDALHATQTLPDGLFAEARATWSEEQLIEVVALAGFYHMISFMVNAFAIAPEPGVPQLPSARLLD